MSVDTAREFVQRYATDAEFRGRIEQAASSQERRAIMDEAGFSEVRLAHLAHALPQSSGGELSDEEFAGVTGGSLDTAIGMVSGMVSVGAFVAASF